MGCFANILASVFSTLNLLFEKFFTQVAYLQTWLYYLNKNSIHSSLDFCRRTR